MNKLSEELEILPEILCRNRHSTVRVARHQGHHYAVKLVQRDDRQAIQWLIEERDILLSLDYPGIVTYHGWLEEDERCGLVMKLGRHGDLLAFVKIRRLQVDEIRFCMMEILLAVEHLHSKGLVHHDLKLKNCVIHDSGHVMLIDLDMAGPVKSTRPWAGTFQYQAPETIVDRLNSGYAADLWSFGVILYRISVGSYPFGDGFTEREDIEDAIINDELEIPDDISDEITQVLQGLLEKDIEKRFGINEVKKCDYFAGEEWESIFTRDSKILHLLNCQTSCNYYDGWDIVEYVDEKDDPFATF